MINNEKLRSYILLFLIFSVFSSKNILIYNEETLVALSFLAFIFFIFHYFGHTIKDSLNERSDNIKMELQNFLNLKQESLKQLNKEHKKISNLNFALTKISVFTDYEISNSKILAEKTLDFITFNRMLQKLKTLSFSKILVQQELQQLMAQDLFAAVLVKFHYLKKSFKFNKKFKSLNHKIIKTGIKLLTIAKEI